jgi:Mn2+/Fe2+ NRAMP family transporter
MLYGVSTATICTTILVTLVFVSTTLSGFAAERNSQSQAPAIYFPANTTMGNIQAAYALFVVVSFVLSWSSTVVQYSQKLGRIKLWVILTTPLVAQVSIFVLIIPIESSQIYNQVSG